MSEPVALSTPRRFSFSFNYFSTSLSNAVVVPTLCDPVGGSPAGFLSFAVSRGLLALVCIESVTLSISSV